jgi:hypothetical protein
MPSGPVQLSAFPAVGVGTMIALFAALALSTGMTSAFGAESIRWKFKAGENVRYQMVQEISQGMKAQGQEFKTSISQTVDLHWNIKSVSGDGVADMSQTIDRVRMKVQGPGPGFEYDSAAAKPAEGQMAAILTPLLKALVGAEFSCKLSGRGELSDIRVPQKLIESLRNAGPAAGGMFSEEAMKNLIGQSSLPLPADSVEQGKNWTQQSKVSVPMLGTMIMDKTYTFQGHEAKAAPGVVQIGVNTKVALEPAADSNVAVKIKSQEGKGEFSFDTQVGRVITSKVNDKLQMSLSIMGQDLEQTTETITTMNLSQDGAPK